MKYANTFIVFITFALVIAFGFFLTSLSFYLWAQGNKYKAYKLTDKQIEPNKTETTYQGNGQEVMLTDFSDSLKSDLLVITSLADTFRKDTFAFPAWKTQSVETYLQEYGHLPIEFRAPEK